MARIRSTLALTFIVFALFVLPQKAFAATPGPGWGSGEYGDFARSLIVPQNFAVQQQLRSIAPFQDAAHFAQNLAKVYDAVCSLGYPGTSEADYFASNWMDASEISRVGRGDCKNHAVLLATLIEALYGNTFGDVPPDLVWVVGGVVQLGNDRGAHAWVMLNADTIQSVSQDAFNMIRNTPITTGVATLPVGARPPWSKAIKWVTSNLNYLAQRLRRLLPLMVVQDDHFYVELEATWKISISEFYHKEYPAVEIHDQWNSYEYRNNPDVILPRTGSLELSSTVWRYGDVVEWKAQGLTSNGPVSMMIQGSWGSVQFSDVTADSVGEVGFSFAVGTNIRGSGRFIVIDRITNTFLMKDYTLVQTITTTTVKPITGALEISDAYWTVGGARVTQAKQGQTVQARLIIRAIGGSVDGNAVMKVRKDKVAWPDSDHATANLRIQLMKDQSAELIVSFIADERSSLLFRGFFIQIDFVSLGKSWTMPDGYPPRLKVV